MRKLKRCPKCGITKERRRFNKGTKRGDGLGVYCTLCSRLIAKNRRKTNPEWTKRHTEYNNALRKERMLKIEKLKEGPCIDCGQRFPPYCMDFDHVRGKKEFYVTESVRSWERTKKEIDKCDLVCANCHRKRTYKRKQFGSGRRQT